MAGSAPVRLADLGPGTRARVIRIGATGPAARRLADLGLAPGTVVEVLRRAPLRDPVLYRVKDYELSLRRAQTVWVEVVRLEVSAEVSADAGARARAAR